MKRSQSNPLEAPRAWGDLSDIFQSKDQRLHPSMADNILTAWPIIFKWLGADGKDSSRILDFGCGTGAFAAQAQERGHDVVGVDASERMIQVASTLYPKVRFFCHDITKATPFGSFDTVVSIMVLQFIANIESVFRAARENLGEGGDRVILCVHSAEYVETCLEKDFKFSRSEDGIFMRLDGSSPIRIYPRPIDQYREAARAEGFKLSDAARPAFPNEYLEHYRPPEEPADVGKFLIMDFKKTQHG